MLITKIFNVESSHRVVNCSSNRCKYSMHGHSAVIEVTLEGVSPDNGGMVYDFGLMKSTIKEFIDSMDHCHLLYNKDDKDYVDFIKKHNARWISLPVSPSAEFLSAFIFRYVNYILAHTYPANGEGAVKVHSVKYHETRTGSATCFAEDVYAWFPEKHMSEVKFSEAVLADWGIDLFNVIYTDKYQIKNKPVEQQAPKNW